MKSTILQLLAAALLPALSSYAAGAVPYTVRPGDTLSAIALGNRTTVEAILRENGLDTADAHRLRVGQVLLIPGPAEAVAPSPPAERPPVPVPAVPAPLDEPVAPVAPVFGPPPPRAAAAQMPVLQEESFYDVWIRDRLALGLSLSFAKLTDGDRPSDLSRRRTFLGYINELNLEDDFAWEPMLTWLASDFVRLGLTWQSTEARTMNCNINAEMGRSMSDGVVSSAGPVLLVEGAYPLKGGEWRPHAGMGLGWYRGDFDEDAWWGLGYAGPKSWKAAGKPGNRTADGRRRYIDVDDEIGLSLVLGVAWRPIPELELDLSLRKTWLEPSCEFGYRDDKTGRSDRQSSGEFTLDSLAVSLTASYVF